MTFEKSFYIKQRKYTSCQTNLEIFEINLIWNY